MSFLGLLDRTMVIHRPLDSSGELRTRATSYVPQGGPVPFTARRPVGLLTDVGPGLADVGDRTVYCEADVDVRERDVLEQMTGPDDLALLEVTGPVARPRGHHCELRCRFFLGDLTAGGS